MKTITKTIKRGVVIKAIRKEHLQTTVWIDIDAGVGVLECPVCAVGAVLRKVSFVKALVDDNKGRWANQIIGRSLLTNCNVNADEIASSSSTKQINSLLKRGLYLQALSGRFETWFNDKLPTAKRRERLVEWVKHNFPREFEFTLSYQEDNYSL